MELTYKGFEAKELTEEGQLSAVVSTFGQVDRDGDLMDAKAFQNSHNKTIPLVWAHQWHDPIGKGVVTADGDKATFTGQFFMDTQRGQEAYRTVKAMGDLQEYSIGFRVKEQEFRKVDGQNVRTFKDIELFEASPVLVGAAFGTHTVGIKSAEPTDIHEQLKALQEQHEGSCELGVNCPWAIQVQTRDDIDVIATIDPERGKALRELEQRLGYRPLIADRL